MYMKKKKKENGLLKNTVPLHRFLRNAEPVSARFPHGAVHINNNYFY